MEYIFQNKYVHFKKEGEGQPIILLHGWGSNSDTFLDFIKISGTPEEQIKQLKEKLIKQYDLVNELYLNKDVNLLIEIDNLEDEIDDMRSIMTEQHIERLENNECSPASSGVFINLVSNLERAGDHLSYIAHTIVE